MRVLFDTGSRSIYLLEAKCNNTANCGKEPKYKGYKSDSYLEWIDGIFVDPYAKNQWHKSKSFEKFADQEDQNEKMLDYGVMWKKARTQPYLDQQTLEVIPSELYDNPVELNYEKGRVTGNLAKERVCMTQD